MAGGSLIIKIKKAFDELIKLELVAEKPVKFFGAQATGCSPISTAVKTGSAEIDPQKPATIARSLAIGNPADGHYAIKTIKQSGGWSEDVSDPENNRFDPAAGGKLEGDAQLHRHRRRRNGLERRASFIARDRMTTPGETTVLCNTGNGLKVHFLMCWPAFMRLSGRLRPNWRSLRGIYAKHWMASRLLSKRRPRLERSEVRLCFERARLLVAPQSSDK